MLGQTTRLEFIIVTVAFLVLLLCSKPPRPGSAGIEGLGDPVPAAPDATLVVPPTQPIPPVEVNMPEPIDLPEPALEPPAAQAAAEPVPPAARLATVDARDCNRLQYDSVMQGEITVRWVWDGQRLVPQKVCVVEEEDGVSAVWVFDQQGNAVLAELQPTGEPSR